MPDTTRQQGLNGNCKRPIGIGSGALHYGSASRGPMSAPLVDPPSTSLLCFVRMYRHVVATLAFKLGPCREAMPMNHEVVQARVEL